MNLREIGETVVLLFESVFSNLPRRKEENHWKPSNAALPDLGYRFATRPTEPDAGLVITRPQSSVWTRPKSLYCFKCWTRPVDAASVKNLPTRKIIASTIDKCVQHSTSMTLVKILMRYYTLIAIKCNHRPILMISNDASIQLFRLQLVKLIHIQH